MKPNAGKSLWHTSKEISATAGYLYLRRKLYTVPRSKNPISYEELVVEKAHSYWTMHKI